jgi:very-short-patch-repair endonuclease
MAKKGHVAWNKGRHLSDEAKKKMSESIKKWFKNNPHPLLGKHHSEETKEKMSRSMRGRRLSDEHKQKISETLKRIRNKGMFKKGHIPWSKGKHLDESTKEKISEAKRGKPNLKLRGRTVSEETKKKFSKMMKKLWKDPTFRENQSQSRKGIPSWCKGLRKETDPRIKKRGEALKGLKKTEEHRKHLSEACKGRIPWNRGRKRPWLSVWNRDPVFIQKRIRGLMEKPTEPEKKLMTIIHKHSLPYRYSGDGSAVIGSFNPDFIHVNGEKKIIELFGRTFHDQNHAYFNVPLCEREEPRKAIYRKMGFDCLIIWDDEIQDEERVLAKIIDFTR